MAVAINAKGTTERNGSVIVGAPRGAGAAALGSKYTLLPGDESDLGDGTDVAKGAVNGVNSAPDITALGTKYDDRFDDPRYYTGDSATDS